MAADQTKKLSELHRPAAAHAKFAVANTNHVKIDTPAAVLDLSTPQICATRVITDANDAATKQGPGPNTAKAPATKRVQTTVHIAVRRQASNRETTAKLPQANAPSLINKTHCWVASP
ncbi:hypothetical protein BN977_01821 [Mycolicibacterium cosmeticum]|uniref:Uncharacterized protein n=1 Tax=Mycolicibacterium cosmeticum TaxID=258533 RepID=W9ANH4_MYCCO|nr:hypothetical protein BN977_01821 [Mycolicibacterium cosmeticum]